VTISNITKIDSSEYSLNTVCENIENVRSSNSKEEKQQEEIIIIKEDSVQLNLSNTLESNQQQIVNVSVINIYFKNM